MIRLYKRGDWYWFDGRPHGLGRVPLREREERAARAAALALLKDPPKAPPKATGPTLAESFRSAMRMRDDWRQSRAQRTLESTFAQVAEYFGAERSLSSITRDEVGLWKASMADRLSPSTVNARLSMLAVLQEESGLQKHGIKHARVAAARPRILTPEEVEGFRRLLPPTMGRLVTFLLETGMRIGEALALRPEHIHGRAAYVLESKGRRPRQVPLTAAAEAAYVPGWDGLTVDRADKLWAQARSQLGLADDDRCVIHALRHTFGSRMAAAGVNAFLIAAWMGHRDLKTTQIYVHLYGPELGAVRDQMEAGTGALLGSR